MDPLLLILPPIHLRTVTGTISLLTALINKTTGLKGLCEISDEL